MPTAEIEAAPPPVRRLIIVVVEPGEDPEIETDPPDSFVTYEIVAALKRVIEIVEEEEILSTFEQQEGDDDGDSSVA